MAQDFTKQKKSLKPNPLELLRDASTTAAQTLNQEVVKPIAKDFVRQAFRRPLPPRNFSGEIQPGESIQMREVFTGQRAKEEHLRKQIETERLLHIEEQMYVEKHTNELRVQIQAIHEEIVKLAQVTPELSQEVELAAIQAPGDPSTYELKFLEHIFQFIKSFRIKIEHASTWLSAVNSRAGKKNVWGENYKKHGAKYLLSGEHYSQRSAG